MRADRFRAYTPAGDVAAEGNVPKTGKLSFESADFIEKVVFYAGDPDEETVAGSVDVQRDGAIEIDAELPDPEED